MIDIQLEELIPLAEVPRRLPKRFGRKPPSVNCVYRWCQRGVSGIRLEFVRYGGTRCTSLLAIQRWFERLAAVENGESIRNRTARQRERAAMQASKRLGAAGR